jgi:hypothetical protein
MRSFLLIASAIIAFAATMTFETNDANAVVCARGVHRAGCAGARGAVVVRRPVAVGCRMVIVNGVLVRRCYQGQAWSHPASADNAGPVNLR